MFCEVTEVSYCASTSENLSVYARFDTSVMLDNMIRYQHVFTAITYLRIMEITSDGIQGIRTGSCESVLGVS